MPDAETIVCPAGHSETFTLGPASTTLLYVPWRIDAHGKPLPRYDPNVTTQVYFCDVCGAQFSRSWQNGKLLSATGRSPDAEPEPEPTMTTAGRPVGPRSPSAGDVVSPPPYCPHLSTITLKDGRTVCSDCCALIEKGG